MTGDEAKDLVFFSKNIQWGQRVENLTLDGIRKVQKATIQARNEIENYLLRRGDKIGEWSQRHAYRLLDELDDMGGEIQAKMIKSVADVSVATGVESFRVHNDILSFGGQVVGFNTVSLTKKQIKSLIEDTPVGGNTLKEWVSSMFDYEMQERIRREIAAGMLKGEGYKKLARRISTGFNNLARHQVVSLARTYTQSINVTAQESIYRANENLVKKVRWSAILEVGVKEGAKGTCPRCAVLDGEEYPLDDHPECPLHPRCRCMLMPVTASYKELGLKLKDVKKAARPWTKRQHRGIDTGRSKTILEVGWHDGDFEKWFNSRSDSFKLNVVGPGRLDLLKQRKIKFKDLVDLKTGKLYTLKELERKAA